MVSILQASVTAGAELHKLCICKKLLVSRCTELVDNCWGIQDGIVTGIAPQGVDIFGAGMGIQKRKLAKENQWYPSAQYWLGYSAAWHRHWYRPATTEWLWHRPGGDQLCPSILINQLSGCYHLPPFIFIWFFNYQILPFIFIIFNNYMTSITYFHLY